jgi:hypothetical protein
MLCLIVFIIFSWILVDITSLKRLLFRFRVFKIKITAL